MLVTGNPPPQKKRGGDYSALIQQTESFLHFEERNENLFKTLHKLQDLIKNIHVFLGQNLYQLIHVFM